MSAVKPLEHEWIESSPGTGLGEPVAHCRCGLYRTTPDPAETIPLHFVGGRSAFDMLKARRGTASTEGAQ